MVCRQTYGEDNYISILVQINNSGPLKKFLIKFEFCALLYSGEELFVVLCFQ